MSLATSEHDPKKRQELVVVGTTLVRGEALASQGRIYVFDIIDVVPEPDRLVTGHKLKLIAKEEVKGAITALSEIGQEGFLLAAQGQKCMVRGLKEDRTLLPVAFMDMQCYVSCAKELKGTGLCVMGDPIKGVSFVGYSVSKTPYFSFLDYKYCRNKTTKPHIGRTLPTPPIRQIPPARRNNRRQFPPGRQTTVRRRRRLGL